MKNSTKALIICGVVVLAIVLLASYMLGNSSNKKTTTEFYQEVGVVFIDTKDAKNINDYKANHTETTVKYVGTGFIITSETNVTQITVDVYNLKAFEGKKLVAQSSFSRGEADFEILKALMSTGMIIDNTDPNAGSFWSSMVIPLLMLGLGVVVLILFFRQIGGGGKSALDFGRTNAQVISNVKVRFNDVAGAEEEKQELQEIVEFLKTPQKFSELGAKIPRGVLLVGNPGTGKTLFAKAVAGEANVPFFSISGSDFVEMFVGVGASRVRDLFNTAKKTQPCIVFIDEIDAVGRQRGAGLGGGNDEREQTLNQLLVQMDGFATNDGIIVMAATNRSDVLDPALLRPGRFDRQIYVNMPDVRGREAILKVHSRNKPLSTDVSFKVLARMTAGFSGADLANLLNEAAILAARANRHAITNIDLYEAINKVVMGPQKKSRLITETDKRITAYHEAGHAILGKLLPDYDGVIHEVSIIPRGMAEGYTMSRPDNDDEHFMKKKLFAEMIMSLGGRVAEELVIKDISAGACGDISHISKYARKMVTEWGMSEEVGPVCYGSESQVFIGRDYQTRTDYSEDMAKLIDQEVEKLIKSAHAQATELLSKNRTILDNMARLLIERETIYSDEVDMIMAGKSVEEIIAYMDKKDSDKEENPFDRISTAKGKSEKADSEVTANNGADNANTELKH